jgi:hypothetical protein
MPDDAARSRCQAVPDQEDVEIGGDAAREAQDHGLAADPPPEHGMADSGTEDALRDDIQELFPEECAGREERWDWMARFAGSPRPDRLAARSRAARRG